MSIFWCEKHKCIEHVNVRCDKSMLITKIEAGALPPARKDFRLLAQDWMKANDMSVTESPAYYLARFAENLELLARAANAEQGNVVSFEHLDAPPAPPVVSEGMVRDALVECAIPYEALLMDAGSRKWWADSHQRTLRAHQRSRLMADETVPAYLLRCPTCKGATGVCVDTPAEARDTAKFVASGVRRGDAVERTTVGAVRQMTSDSWCSCARCNRRKTLSPQLDLLVPV